jgi:hypothetical protein
MSYTFIFFSRGNWTEKNDNADQIFHHIISLSNPLIWFEVLSNNNRNDSCLFLTIIISNVIHIFDFFFQFLHTFMYTYILNKAFLLILIIASSQHIFTLFSNSQDLVLCICIIYGIYNIWSDLHFSSSEHYLASFHQSFRHKMSYSWCLIFLIFLLQFIFSSSSSIDSTL